MKTYTLTTSEARVWRRDVPWAKAVLTLNELNWTHIHTRAASFTPLIRVRESCGPSARCLSCLGEQTGSCLWWQRDQSRGHILRSHAKVDAAHPAAMFCSAARIPGIYIIQWRQQTSVCVCVCAMCYALQMDALQHFNLLRASKSVCLSSVYPTHVFSRWDSPVQSYRAILFIHFILGVLLSSKGISMNLILWKIGFYTVKFN